ncbi:hypothetical protein BDZ89DRAFT_415817 [Hymenopellis radicata]|nr:hypothetical protein BDZ89DRAFT_415817 [Hymenopellis radicata]
MTRQRSIMAPFIETHTPEIFKFTPPSLTLDLALGHKNGDWYLLFARPYPTADSREISRLNTRRGRAKCGLKLGNPHFLFDLGTASGWEKDGQTLLGFLLDMGPAHPAILRNWGASGNGQAMEVEVLIPEHRLLHWCSGCASWEATTNSRRWIRVRKTRLPCYLCPSCYLVRPRRGCWTQEAPAEFEHTTVI